MNLFMTQSPNKIMIASCFETNITNGTQAEPNSRGNLGIRQILTRANLPIWTGQPKLEVLKIFELKEDAYTELHDLTSTLENMVLKLFYNLKLIVRYRKTQLDITDEDILRDTWVILVKTSQIWFPMSNKQLREAKIETCLINEVM